MIQSSIGRGCNISHIWHPRRNGGLQIQLSYRKQIARQLRTQYVEGIDRPKYYTVTLKSSLRSLKITENRTIGQTIHDLLLVELFDVKYYCDLEMWVRDHSRSLKVVPFESLVCAFHSNYGRIFSYFGDIQRCNEWPDLEIWVWGPSRSLRMARFDRPCMTFC